MQRSKMHSKKWLIVKPSCLEAYDNPQLSLDSLCEVSLGADTGVEDNKISPYPKWLAFSVTSAILPLLAYHQWRLMTVVDT